MHRKRHGMCFRDSTYKNRDISDLIYVRSEQANITHATIFIYLLLLNPKSNQYVVESVSSSICWFLFLKKKKKKKRKKDATSYLN